MTRPWFLEPEAERILAHHGVSADAYGNWVATELVRRTRIATTIALALLSCVASWLALRLHVPAALLPALPLGLTWLRFRKRGRGPGGTEGDAIERIAAARYGRASYLRSLRRRGWEDLLAHVGEPRPLPETTPHGRLTARNASIVTAGMMAMVWIHEPGPVPAGATLALSGAAMAVNGGWWSVAGMALYLLGAAVGLPGQLG